MWDKTVIRQQIGKLQAELEQQVNSNPRLKIGLIVIGLIILVQPLFLLYDLSVNQETDLAEALKREARVQRAANEVEWLEREAHIKQLLNNIQPLFALAATTGEARAILDGWLTGWAAEAGIAVRRIQVEAPSPAGAHQSLYRVVASLDGSGSPSAMVRLLTLMEKFKHRVVVERLEMAQQSGARLKLDVAVYFIVGAGEDGDIFSGLMSEAAGE